MRLGRMADMVARAPGLAIYLAAALVRGAALARSGPILSGDTQTYEAAARALRQSLLTGSDSFLTAPPLFPFFLAILPDDAAAAVAQALLVALMAPLTHAAVARHYGRSAGLAAGAIVAVHPTFVFWSTYLLTDSLALLLLAAAIERASASLKDRDVGASLVGGAFAAALVLTRAAYSLSLLPLAVAQAIAPRAGRRRLLLFVLGVSIVVGVPVLRNLVAIGRAIPYEGHAWGLLWAGTRWNEVGRGTVGVDLIVPPDIAAASPDVQELYFRDEFVRFIREQPGDFVVLSARKAVWYFLPVYPEWSLAHKLISGSYLTLLYVLAVAGAFTQRRRPLTWLLLGLIATFLLTAMVTIVDFDARYRLPAELCVIALAGIGVTSSGGWWLRARARRFLRDPASRPSPA